MSVFLKEREKATLRRQRPRARSENISTPRPDIKAEDFQPLSDRLEWRLVAKALTIRRTEEKLLELFAQGKLFGTVHTCIGQEWSGVAVTEGLEPGDYLFSNHRGHGHYLSWTDDVEGLIAEIMGRATGVCGGRGGSQHLCRNGFFSNGIQGGIVPVAGGLAAAQQMQSRGTGITTVFIGDGTLGQGVVYETLNLAAKWSLPLLIVLEDNGIAQSTPTATTLAGNIDTRFKGFGIEVCRTNTWQPDQLITNAQEASQFVRQARRPMLLHVDTFRLKAHSKGDDQRDPEFVRAYAEEDPLNRILAEKDPEIDRLVTAIDQRLEKAIEKAEAAPFTSIPEQQVESAETRISEIGGKDGQWQPVDFESGRIDERIRQALAEAMENDERIILLGEDIADPYGGAFKVTRGLSERFRRRVYNTPISEAAIVGMGNGLALAGKKPVVEIMFGDFLLLAADQWANHAAKFAGIYNHQVKIPLVVRTPMGGYRGYGPTHSQCLEKHFLGLPGTRVLALHKRCCPRQFYRKLLSDNDLPTLVVENKLLYGKQAGPTPPPGFELSATREKFPVTRLKSPGQSVLTLVAYGGMADLAETAIQQLWEQEELACELLIPSQLYPLELSPYCESVLQTGHLLMIEEGQGFAAWGSELIAQLNHHHKKPALTAGRISAAQYPIPGSRPAEEKALPKVNDIVQSAIDLILGD